MVTKILATPSVQSSLSVAMAPSKKSPASSKTRSSASQPYIKKVKGENFYHDAKTANRLKMLKGGKAVRDKDGRIIQAAAFQKGEDETKPGRVQPDRRWFGALSLAICVCGSMRLRKFMFSHREYQGNLPDCLGSFPDESFHQAERPLLGSFTS